MVDYLNELREHCLEAFTGIIQGLKGEDDKNINRMFVYISFYSHDKKISMPVNLPYFLLTLYDEYYVLDFVLTFQWEKDLLSHLHVISCESIMTFLSIYTCSSLPSTNIFSYTFLYHSS